MTPRSLAILTCPICYTLAFGFPAPAAEHSIQFRWLQTDPQNADALVNAIKANASPATLTPATANEESVAKVNQQILSRELNPQMSASYVSLKSKGRTPGMEFVFDGKLRPGVPEFVATKAAPLKDQPVVVLVLTPWYDIIR